MAINEPGATFISKGIKYILQYGPKGNLRPYTIGPVKSALKTKNPYLIVGSLLLAGIVFTILITSSKSSEEKYEQRVIS
jgi:hypothetical protein